MSEPSVRDLDRLLSRSHLPALDGVRAVAVFVVMSSHSAVATIPGDLGVSGFFVLSGFLITWLLLREHDRAGSVSLRRFYARRTLRIFPAYYVFLALSFVADAILGTPWTLGLGAAALFYLMNYYNAFLGHPGTSIAHTWSLAVEEQFYLFWPWLFRRVVPFGRRALARTLAMLALGVMAWRCLLFLVLGASEAYVYNAFDTRFDNLAVGCLLAVLLADAGPRRFAERFGRSAWMPVPTLALLWISRTSGADWHYGPGFTIDAVLLAILLVQLMQLADTPAWRWLDHPTIRYLGRISYPMYLWHGWGLSAARHVDVLPKEARFVLGVLLTIGVASASYALIEKPFLRMKKRYEPTPPAA